MPRLIFKCHYLKNRPTAHLTNLVSYIATREGVEKIDDTRRLLPATSEQSRQIEMLLQQFPETKDLFEYQDYHQNPTRENASAFISLAIEYNIDQIGKRKNYVDYIANRPRVERVGTHGLFTDAGVPVVLSHVQEEVSQHEGNVWTDIISLRREDAERLGYDHAHAWQALLRGKRNQIAEAMKITPENLRWYAAFHDEGHHPHVHLIAYSANPKEGYLTKRGIEQMRSALATEIFRHDLLEIYQEQTERRDELGKVSLETIRKLMEQMKRSEWKAGTEDGERKVQTMLLQLEQRLRSTKSRKSYGYLPPAIKKLVDQIVDELGRTEPIAECYQSWYRIRSEVLKTYTDTIPELPPLSSQPEFRKIKNMVLKSVLQLSAQEDNLQLIQEENQEGTEQNQIENIPYKTYPLSAYATSTSLIRSVASIFYDESKQLYDRQNHRMDRKRRKELQKKKQAQGHAYGDHEQEL